MIKLLSRVGPEAKIPYKVCKGSVNCRNKMAQRLYKKFCIELDKNAIESVCATEDFTTALKNTLHPYKIAFNVNAETGSKNKGTLTPQFSVKNSGANSAVISCESFNLSLPMDDDKKIIIDKYCAAHEVRHLLDHIFNPKMSLARWTNQFNNQHYDTNINIVRNKLFNEFDTPLNIRELEKEITGLLSSVPDEISVEVLQKARYQLKTEINAYKNELNYMKKGFGYFKNFERIIYLEISLKQKAKFPQKLKFINRLLREKLANIRSANKELLN